MNYILIILGAIIYYITMPLWIWFVLFAKDRVDTSEYSYDEWGDIVDRHGNTVPYDGEKIIGTTLDYDLV